jgi:hypothetical protein
MPATAASRYCSGLSLSSLCVTSVKLPSGFGRLPTTSVKVPPRSIQNCQRGVATGPATEEEVSDRITDPFQNKNDSYPS